MTQMKKSINTTVIRQLHQMNECTPCCEENSLTTRHSTGEAIEPIINAAAEQNNSEQLVTYYQSGEDDITIKALYILERRRNIIAQLAAEEEYGKKYK